TGTPATTTSSGSSGMGRGARVLIALLLMAVAIAAWTTWIVLRRRGIEAAKRRKARAAARARQEAEAGETPADAEAVLAGSEAGAAEVLAEPTGLDTAPADVPGWAEPEPILAEQDETEPAPEPPAADDSIAAPIADVESEPIADIESE